MAQGPCTVAIIGGGIGGLTAALALRRAGFVVKVYEQARDLADVGTGIQLGPNGARILDRLGLCWPISTRRRCIRQAKH